MAVSELPGAVQKALEDEGAIQAIAKNSDQVGEVLGTYLDGRVVVYGESPGLTSSRARRTEIIVGPKDKVVIHKNTGVGRGIYSLAPHYSRLDVIHGEQVSSLTIKEDPLSADSNPIYLFIEGSGPEEKKFGWGWGQSMDLRLASVLTGEWIGGGNASFSDEVLTWIKEKLKD